MKRLVFILIVFNLSFLYAQVAVKENALDFPQEKIFIHYNSSFLVSGERLYYKIYCLDAKTNHLSNFSKIAYLELIGVNNQFVFKHKIRLKSGIGDGDFFMPTSVPSGNYKLIAYTQWMRNNSDNTFFKGDITVINPFLRAKEMNVNPLESKKDSLVIPIATYYYKPVRSQKNTIVNLELNKESFSNREKVTLTLKSLVGKESSGNYSISVRKRDTIRVAKRTTSLEFMKSNMNINTVLGVLPTYIPELRGELVSGKVILESNGKPAKNIKVAFSISGKNYFLKIANTNNLGVFYFNLDKAYENSNAIVQVVDPEREKYRIEMNKHKSPEYDKLTFYDFKTSSKLKNLIIEKSISNQIENAYHSVKKDSVLPVKEISPFYGSVIKNYGLDDYTRFSSLEETIIEVVDEAFVKKKKGKYTLHVKLSDRVIRSNLSPLVLMDGIFLQDHDVLFNYNIKKIKSISVIREKYIYGSLIFEGIISIQTFDGDYQSNSSGEFIKNIEMFKPQVFKKRFNQSYKDLKLVRIPDYRNQLLWEPNIHLERDKTSISFFTSDVKGEYEICIEGFNKKGKPIFLNKIFVVR